MRKGKKKTKIIKSWCKGIPLVWILRRLILSTIQVMYMFVRVYIYPKKRKCGLILTLWFLDSRLLSHQSS